MLGENPALCLPDNGLAESGASLRRRAREEVERCAAEAVLTAPLGQVGHLKSMAGVSLTIGSDGRGVIPLPDDFLRLYSVRLSGWERDISEILPHDHWMRKWQCRNRHPLRGSRENPRAFYSRGDDGGVCVELFEAKAGDTIAEGWYAPRPIITEADAIDLSPEVAEQCVRLICQNIR